MAYIEIEKVLETARNGYHSDFGRSMADLTSLREVLEDTPTADVAEVPRWISVKDRLPYENIRVLSLCEDNIVRINMIKGGEFPRIMNRQRKFVETTHWQPLPEPPRTPKERGGEKRTTEEGER